MKLLFSSKINGENVEELKNAYSGKNDILFTGHPGIFTEMRLSITAPDHLRRGKKT